MTTFNLYERPDGRVVLSREKEPKSVLIRTIKADNWKDARKTISADEFFHDPGHGYYVHPKPGAYQRQRDYHERLANAVLRERMLIASIYETQIRPKKGNRETVEV